MVNINSGTTSDQNNTLCALVVSRNPSTVMADEDVGCAGQRVNQRG